MGQIRLIGSREFIDKTREALMLLKEKDFMSYKVVIKYLGAIVQNKIENQSYYDAFKEVPTFFVSNATYTHNTPWYAAAILHEAYHGKLFEDALEEDKNPLEEYYGYHAEIYCLTKQIECLKKLKAKEEDILWAINHYDKRWWEELNETKHAK